MDKVALPVFAAILKAFSVLMTLNPLRSEMLKTMQNGIADSAKVSRSPTPRFATALAFQTR